MDHFIEIYRNKTDKYHQMISFEDHENNLLSTIESITRLADASIIDLGSGTGRLPILFKPFKPNLVALDISYQMLFEQKTQMIANGDAWDIAQGDIRILPFRDAWADLTTAGWAAGHFCAWYPEKWQEYIDTVVGEMLRVTKDDGTVMIMETLGTGQEIPAPPTKDLARYYQQLEEKWGFNREEVRTDYKFASVEEAKQNTAFFFGEALSKKIEEEQWQILPEWTGVWHRKK